MASEDEVEDYDDAEKEDMPQRPTVSEIGNRESVAESVAENAQGYQNESADDNGGG